MSRVLVGLAMAVAGIGFLAPNASAFFNCTFDLTVTQCAGPGENVITWKATCDGTCEPCKIFIYRYGTVNCPELITKIAEFPFGAGVGSFDDGGGDQCRNYKVQVRRSCTGIPPDDGIAACEIVLPNCGDCPCPE